MTLFVEVRDKVPEHGILLFHIAEVSGFEDHYDQILDIDLGDKVAL